MSDSDSSSRESSIPSWQRTENKEQEDQLTVARRFLEDEAVKDAPHDKKVEFLKFKDVSEEDIQKLLGKSSEPTKEPSAVCLLLSLSSRLSRSQANHDYSNPPQLPKPNLNKIVRQ